jgi:hypothetical protein
VAVTDHLPGRTCCDTPLDTKALNVRCFLPDALLAVPTADRAPRWGTQALLYAPDVGAFMRVLLPLRLTGGMSLTYGTWIAISDEDFGHAMACWDAPAYAELRISGTLANAITPWRAETLDAPVTTAVRDVGQIPYVIDLLTGEYDRDTVLGTLSHPLPVALRRRLDDTWSLRRDAGFAARVVDDDWEFTDQDHVVRARVVELPPAMTFDEFMTRNAQNMPRLPAKQTITESDGGLVRHAFWLSGDTGETLVGYAFTPGSCLEIGCFYRDPAELGWAQSVWRSAKAH